MENNKNKKSVKFQGDMLIFCDFIQVFVFTRNHHLKPQFILIKICMVSVAYHVSKRYTEGPRYNDTVCNQNFLLLHRICCYEDT